MEQVRKSLAEWIAPLTDGMAAEKILELFETPKSGWGDVALPCFRVKVGGKSNKDAAAALAAKLSKHPLVAEWKAEGGYLNLVLNTSALAAEVMGRFDAFASQKFELPDGKGKRLTIDFSSPNVAKEFSLGHLRSTMLGNSILRLYQAAGWDTESINHLGDWGHQFGVVILAYEQEGKEAELRRDPIRYLQALYVKYSMREKAEDKRAEAAKAGKTYDGAIVFKIKAKKGESEAEAAAKTQEILNGDPYLKNPLLPSDPKSVSAQAKAIDAALQGGNKKYRAIWTQFRELSIDALKRTYADLRIEFKHYMGESFFEDKMLPVVERIESLGLLVSSQDAKVVELDASMGKNKDGSAKVCVILKSDGSSNYATRDLAAAVYRRDTFRFDRNIYVVDSRQSEHFASVFYVLKKMGYEWAEHCIHVPFGAVLADGEVMSTRQGNVILFEDYVAKNEVAVRGYMDPPAVSDSATEAEKKLAEERKRRFQEIVAEIGEAGVKETVRSVAKAAILFAMLRVGRMEEVNYRSDEAIDFNGETGPRVQMSYAKTGSVLRNFVTTFGHEADPKKFDPAHYTTEYERNLLRLLGDFKGVVRRSVAEAEPYHVARFALEISDWLNRYWRNVFFLDETKPAESASRVALLARVRQVVARCLWLLGIDAPERM